MSEQQDLGSPKHVVIGNKMFRLRGRTTLMIILMIAFTLLIIVYHILSNEVEEISSNRLNPRSQFQDVYTARGEKFHNFQPLGSQNVQNNNNNNDNDNAPLFKGHKIVHFDLKGAPPKIQYYRYIFQLLRKLGTTGILLEYEDMFPYKGSLSNISARNCYSQSDIRAIQESARENDLILIPLIQTFGHLEFVLKLNKYKDYREVFRYPQVICPTFNKSLPLIFEMIDQIVKAHPDIQHIHIGADEVYQIGECSRCLDLMAKKQWTKQQLFLNHVSEVAEYIRTKYPALTVLMWDDEFREISPREIMDRKLNELVQPVVWKYTTDPGSSLTDQLWENYASMWKNMWVATAFKGATEPDRYYTDISYHLENHQRWMEIVDRYPRINFQGVMLTGWQRYDHFSVLCELLPSAIPSLALSLYVVQSPVLNPYVLEVPKRVLDILKCPEEISLTIGEPQYGWTKCDYFGSAIYAATLRLFMLNQEIARMEQDNTFKGWLKPYNVKYAFSSPSHVERAIADLDRHKMELLYIEKDMRTAMEDIYNEYTIQEWIETFLLPINEKLNQLWEAKEKILERNAWPRRPLVKPEL